MTNIASPIADSAAATVKTNNANNWPKISSKKTAVSYTHLTLPTNREV